MSRFTDAVQDLQSKQKSSLGVSFYTRWVNRPGGRLFAAAFSLTPISPNQVSLISGAVTLGGVLLIAAVQPSWWLGVLVWFVLALGFVLDSADGQLARLTGKGSAAGEWLDHVIDAGKVVLVHAAVLVSWFRFVDLPDSRLLLVPIAFMFSTVVMFVGGTLAEMLMRSRRADVTTPRHSRVRASLLLAGDYGVFCLVFLLLGSPSAFVVAYSLLAAVNLALLVVLLAKWFRELSNLKQGSPDSSPPVRTVRGASDPVT